MTSYGVKCLMRDVNDDFPAALARYLFVSGKMSREQFCRIEDIAGEILGNDECRRVSQLAVGGQDMMALGLKGKQIGDTLSLLLDGVMSSKVENTAEALLAMAESLKNG